MLQQIAAVDFDQALTGRGGRIIPVKRDVGNFAAQLQEIDKSLLLGWNDAGEYFVVYQEKDDGSPHTITRMAELDGRVIIRIAQIVHAYRNGNMEIVADEADQMDAEADRENERRLADIAGDAAERLYHQGGIITGRKSSIFVDGSERVTPLPPKEPAA